MLLKPMGVLTIATMSALAAGGGVLQIAAHARSLPAQESRIPKAADGHYWATGDVDGAQVRFLVDTGSSAVTLTATDARRLGIDLSHLHFDQPVFTAAGDERAAPIILDHIEVAGARIDQVRAMVMKEGLSTSLLGMSYLGRLSRIEATPDALVLSR
jgi:aspartyl protease family protein